VRYFVARTKARYLLSKSESASFDSVRADEANPAINVSISDPDDAGIIISSITIVDVGVIWCANVL
jgi:hypothetical protein